MKDEGDLTQVLRGHAARSPSRPALTAPGRSPLSFAALDEQRRRASGVLATLGIARGDVVAWSHDDRARTAAALAVLPDASTIAPLAPSVTRDVVAGILRRLDPKAIVVPPRGETVAGSVARELGIAILTTDDDGRSEAGAFDLRVQREAPSLERARRWPAAWACIGATSGSTGRPKLVSHGHRQILRTARAAAERTGMDEHDASGHIMPLHLSGGMRTAFYQALAIGAATHVLDEADVDGLLDAIDDGAVTYASASFTMQRELLARIEGGRATPRGRFRFMRVSSGRLEADEMDRLERALGVPVVTGLASSETGTTAQQSPGAPRKRGSVGPVLDSEVRLVDADGSVVPPGETGEIQVRSPQLFDGYVDDDALNAAAFVDGWFRMGDLARFDADGELWLVGRVKDVINRGGDKIAPLEIDAALLALPGVADAASFGVPHPRLGEEVVAAVVMRDGVPPDADALLDAVRGRLGARRAPRRLWFVGSLPRTEGGKLRRSALPDWVGYTPAGAEGASAISFSGSPLETALAALWSSVLERADIGRDAAFHAQGGDDERAQRLCVLVDAAFGVTLAAGALRDEASTIARMARIVEDRRVGSV